MQNFLRRGKGAVGESGRTELMRLAADFIVSDPSITQELVQRTIAFIRDMRPSSAFCLCWTRVHIQVLEAVNNLLVQLDLKLPREMQKQLEKLSFDRYSSVCHSLTYSESQIIDHRPEDDLLLETIYELTLPNRRWREIRFLLRLRRHLEPLLAALRSVGPFIMVRRLPYVLSLLKGLATVIRTPDDRTGLMTLHDELYTLSRPWEDQHLLGCILLVTSLSQSIDEGTAPRSAPLDLWEFGHLVNRLLDALPDGVGFERLDHPLDRYPGLLPVPYKLLACAKWRSEMYAAAEAVAASAVGRSPQVHASNTEASVLERDSPTPTGPADSASEGAWYHNEKPPQHEFEYGPLVGKLKELADAIRPRTPGGEPNVRQLKALARKGLIWMFKVSGQCYYVWFKDRGIYETAQRRSPKLALNEPNMQEGAQNSQNER
jgi:hypothetical protein